MNHLTRRRTDPALLRRGGRVPRSRTAPRVLRECRALYGSTPARPQCGGCPARARARSRIWRPGVVADREPRFPRAAAWWRPVPAGGGPPRRGAVAVLMVAAFLAGRFYPAARRGPAHMAAADPQGRDRILLLAVGDYLERSQMVLVELANTETRRAARYFRRAGARRRPRQRKPPLPPDRPHTGDVRVAALLDELDRVLLEISHAPSRLTPATLENLRERLRAEGILFKIRVLGSNVRDQEEPAAIRFRRRTRLKTVEEANT